MKISLPATLKKYFWGDDLTDFKWPDHKKYITQTLLEKGNRDAIKWLFDNVSKTQVSRMLPELKLSKKSSNYWKLYLS